MATVAVTTNAIPLERPSQSLIDRDSSGNLYTMIRGSTSNLYVVYRSTDLGVSWSIYASVTRASIAEMSGIYIDSTGFLNWAYRTNESSQDRIYFRRLNLTTATWSSEVLIVSAANGGTGGLFFTGIDFVITFVGVPGYVLLAIGLNVSGTSVSTGINIYGATINAAGTVVRNDSILSGGSFRTYYELGNTGRCTPSVDLEHNGDGKTAATPHVWIAFGRNVAYVLKLSWTGAGWSLPSNAVTVRSSIITVNSLAGRFDGTRFLVAYPEDPSSTPSVVRISQRNKSNSFTQSLFTPAHPQGTVKQCAIAIEADGDFRVYGVGTSTPDLYWVAYDRTAGTWGSWTIVSTNDILGSDPNQYSLRRGTSGNLKYDLVWVSASPTPNTVTHLATVITASPSTPTWVTPQTGAAADVNASLLLDWNFVDIDPLDTQSAYAVSRQIGAGALNYWRASDSTWQVAEVQNTSSTSALTLASGWAAGSDANYTFKVKVWDSTNLPSPYSAGVILIPSVKVNPTITSPTAAQVLTASSVTMTWTVSEQTAFRVQLATNPGGVVVHDSGWISSSALTYTPPTVLATGTGWTLTLETKNNEGLTSTAQTRNFTVTFVTPATPALVLTAQPTLGYIQVAITNPTPSGGQPALINQDLFRRLVVTANIIPNPTFETNLTDWLGTNATLTRSSVQAHTGTWAGRVVPNGVSADSYGETTSQVINQALDYTAETWIRADTVNKPVNVYIHWYTAAGAYISSVSATLTAPIAGVWFYLTVTGTPPGTAGKAAVGAGLSSTPAASDAAYIDDVYLRPANLDAGVRVKRGLASGVTYNDWTVPALSNVEYRVQAFGTNGTSTFSAWTA